MKKCIFFGLLLFFPVTIFATNCDITDMARYKKLASNINFTYDFIEVNNNVTFNITISNMHNDLYIIEDKKFFSSKNLNKVETTLMGYEAGQTYRFAIIPYDKYCFASNVLIKYITLPSYNKYYSDPLCSDIPDYKLCHKWSAINLSYEEFVQEIKVYKNSEIYQIVEPVNKTVQDDTLNKFIVWVLKYYIYILIAIISSCTLGIILLSKKNEFKVK
ncbi:MAG: hypothetical protein RR847_02250 [Bacilli bacterium]